MVLPVPGCVGLVNVVLINDYQGCSQTMSRELLKPFIFKVCHDHFIMG